MSDEENKEGTESEPTETTGDESVEYSETTGTETGGEVGETTGSESVPLTTSETTGSDPVAED